MNKIRLGVNIDHIATLKTNRKTDYPSLIQAVKVAEKSGADLITIHLREDRRHIQDSDVFEIRNKANLLNLEMALTDEMINICIKVKPDYCCIVPEKREELTTEGGLDLVSMSKNKLEYLSSTIEKILKNGTRVSLFIDPEIEQIDRAVEVGANCVELHTGKYAELYFSPSKDTELDRIAKSAEYAKSKDLQVHAGHGLNLLNLPDICKIRFIEELNIGHAIISDSIFKGLEKTISEYKGIIDYD